MAHDDRITAMVLSAQERIFRLAARDHGLSLKAISLESGIPYNTIRAYAAHNGEQAMMPVAAVCKLVGVIPDELLSHLFEPVDRLIIAPSDENNHDATADNCIAFTGAYAKARSKDSPAGPEIADCEHRNLKAAKARLA